MVHLNFSVQPVEAYRVLTNNMTSCIKGSNGFDCPQVKIVDESKKRNGRLKVGCISLSQDEYRSRFHCYINSYCDYKDGMVIYEFSNSSGTVDVDLAGLYIKKHGGNGLINECFCLCCQVVFDDNTKSNILTSTSITNAEDKHKIDYWNDGLFNHVPKKTSRFVNNKPFNLQFHKHSDDEIQEEIDTLYLNGLKR